MKIYTLGYVGLQAEQVRGIAERLDALVVDTRLSPFSSSAMWGKPGLMKVLGSRYLHVPEFGNVNYQSPEKGVKLANPGRGLLRIAERPVVILMCSCHPHGKCHRVQVAEYLASHPENEFVGHLDPPAETQWGKRVRRGWVRKR